MSLEHLNRVADNAKPFKYLLKEPADDLERRDRATEMGHLRSLRLGPESTAEDVRKVASSLRLKFEERNGGLNKRVFSALAWALETTRDTITNDEFLRFLGSPDQTFEEIEADRWDFR